MHLGIADICLLDHMRAGQTQEEFIRIAAQLGRKPPRSAIPQQAQARTSGPSLPRSVSS